MNGYQDYLNAVSGERAGTANEMYDPYAETAAPPSYAADEGSSVEPVAYDRAHYGGGRGRGGPMGGGGRDRPRRDSGGRGGPMRSERGGGRGGRGGRGRPEKPSVSTKLYVSSLPDTCRRSDLIKLFEQHGKVIECDIVKHYAFIHYEDSDEAKAAVDALNNYEFQGSTLKVELSISRVRQKPGMGGPNECYKCGKGGHWSKDCPTDRGSRRPSYRDREDDDDDYYARPPPPDPYYRDPYYRDRYPPPPPHDRYRPYADPYERRRPPPPAYAYSDPYYRDPYARPPPDVYGRAPPPAARDRYYDDPYAKSYPALAEETAHAEPPV